MRGPGPMRGSHGQAKAKNFKGTILRLATYFKAAKIALLLVLAVTVLATIFNTISPKQLGKATTSIQTTVMQRMLYDQIADQFGGEIPEQMQGMTGSQLLEMLPAEVQESVSENARQAIADMPFDHRPTMDFGYIGGILLLCLGLYAFSAFFNFIQAFVMAGLTQKIVRKMRNDVSAKLNRLPIKYFDAYTHGEILSRVTNDIDNISNTLQQSLTQIITSVVTIISVLVMMLSISGWLTLICICTLPFIVLIAALVAKHSQKQFAANQKELGELSGHVEEIYSGRQVIEAYGQQDKVTAQFDSINNRLYAAGWKSQFISGLIMPLTNFINNLGFLLICVVGGMFSINGAISLGDVVAFTQYSRQFTQPIVQTANIVNILQSTAASAERVFEILDAAEEEPDAPDAVELANPEGRVSFQHVRFGYREDKILISDMNIDVQPGQKVAIVGPTGAGKTTLVNLLMRFYEIQQGEILIDGISTKDLSRQAVHSLFCMVLQDTWLFEGTVRENLVYCTPGVSDETMEKACKAVGLHHFIRTLPKGYDTILNDQVSLSQGQKQQLTIARAMIADKPMLILDEATSSVDTRTEQKIQAAMDQLMEHRTSFVIAHRLSTIKNADLILVLREGDIVESGTHDQLLQQGGFYAELYNSQFEQVS